MEDTAHSLREEKTLFSPRKHEFQVKARTTFLMLFLFTSFVIFFNLWGRTVENRDYVRYPEISRRILELSDWTVMHLGGKIYDHKPPFHFWNTAIAYKIFGVNAFAARLPAALFGLLGVVILYFFATAFFKDKNVALLAALSLLCCYGYLWWTRRTRVDMVFSICFSIALLCFYTGWRTTASGWKKTGLYFGFWGSLACAFLTKGYVAFSALLVAIVFSLFALWRPQLKGRLSIFRFLAGGIAFVLPIAVWVFFLVRHPEFQEYWEKLTWSKLKTKMDQIHQSCEGPFYYIPQFFGKLAPMVAFFFLGLWGIFRNRDESRNNSVLLFCLCWFVPYAFVLQLTTVKDDRYLLPIYMPCALISAWAIRLFELRDTPVYSGIVKWADRILLWGALAFCISPFIWAWYHGSSLLRALVYVGILIAVMLGFRRFWSRRPIGILISFALIVLTIDLCDTARNRSASGNHQVYMELQKRNLGQKNLVFFRCPPREHQVLSFYFESILERITEYEELFREIEAGKIRGIVTPQRISKEVQERLSDKGLVPDLNRIDLERGLVLLSEQDSGQKAVAENAGTDGA